MQRCDAGHAKQMELISILMELLNGNCTKKLCINHHQIKTTALQTAVNILVITKALHQDMHLRAANLVKMVRIELYSIFFVFCSCTSTIWNKLQRPLMAEWAMNNLFRKAMMQLDCQRVMYRVDYTVSRTVFDIKTIAIGMAISSLP